MSKTTPPKVGRTDRAFFGGSELEIMMLLIDLI